MTDLSKLLPQMEIRYDEPMSRHTSFRIGGPLRAMVFPKNEEELIKAVSALKSADISPLIIGNGTNLLAEDGPLDMVAVKTAPQMAAIEQISDTALLCSCGVTLPRLSMFALDHGLTGLEFAQGIPGSLGGGIFMNAGAYGGEIGHVTKSVRTLLPSGEIADFRQDQCDFSYRHSVFSVNNAIVLSVIIELPAGNKDEIRRTVEDLNRRRREKQPIDMPSGGSTFKRPPGGYAAKMIDEAGLSGFSIGGAAISEKHAGFIVNKGDATFKDVMMLIEHVQKTIFEATNITLEPEIRIIRNS